MKPWYMLSHAFLASSVALALMAMGTQAWASGARQGVKAKPGEIVLLRDVSTRPAYRPAPPGIALIADPTPREEVHGTLGTGRTQGLDELSDDDYAAMGSGVANPVQAGGGNAVDRSVNQAVGSALGGALGRNGVVSGQALGQTIGGPMGAVGNATRGIGSQVTHALSQFPLGQSGGK